MQAEELITGYSVPWGTKGATKTEYAITEAGLAYLHARQAEPVTYRPCAKFAASAYFEFADDDDARQCLTAHLMHYRGVVEDVRYQIQELEEGSWPSIAVGWRTLLPSTPKSP